MDAQYVKGMLKNPDVQPNAAINRWIAAILLFDFKLVHVLAEKHQGPDGLSRRKPIPGEDNEDEDPEDWIDNTLSLSIWTDSWQVQIQNNKSILQHTSQPPPLQVYYLQVSPTPQIRHP